MKSIPTLVHKQLSALFGIKDNGYLVWFCFCFFLKNCTDKCSLGLTQRLKAICSAIYIAKQACIHSTLPQILCLVPWVRVAYRTYSGEENKIERMKRVDHALDFLLFFRNYWRCSLILVCLRRHKATRATMSHRYWSKWSLGMFSCLPPCFSSLLSSILLYSCLYSRKWLKASSLSTSRLLLYLLKINQ